MKDKFILVLLSCACGQVVYGLDNFNTEIYLDGRYSISKGEPSWFDDWLGKGRYGGELNGDAINKFRLAEVSLLTKFDINWDTKGFVHLKNDPEQQESVDLVEAYVKYKPVPKSAISYALKAGLFFPHISRENVGAAWTTPYTISPSAINSWVGEEIRTLGLELTAKHKGETRDLSFTAAIFGYNDPSGTLLAYRGWGIGDAKVGAFGELPLARLPAIGLNSTFVKQPFWVRPIREIDERAGYYIGADWKQHTGAQFGLLYYDNRGDPETVEAQQYSWHTKFLSAYLELDLSDEIKLISQYMIGSTKMGIRVFGGGRQVDIDYVAAFVLLSRKKGKLRLSARYDWFGVDDNTHLIIDNNNEDGDALTLALSVDLREKDALIFEYLHIDSKRPAREDIGFKSHQKNKTIQLSYRLNL